MGYITQPKLSQQEGFFVSCLHLFLHADTVTPEKFLE